MKKSDFQNGINSILLFYLADVMVNLIGNAILKWYGIIAINGGTAVQVSFLAPLAFMALAAAAMAIAFAVFCAWDTFRHWGRDRRIIRQAKAAGVWDKPLRLGGRALELKAWQLCCMKRIPGETDQQLRYRLAGGMPKAGQAAEQAGWKERMLRLFLRGH